MIRTVSPTWYSLFSSWAWYFLRPLHALAVQRVREATLDDHGHRLVGLVAHHHAGPRLAAFARFGLRASHLLALILAHVFFSQPSGRARARGELSSGARCRAGSARPDPGSRAPSCEPWKRSLNCSSLSSFSRASISVLVPVPNLFSLHRFSTPTRAAASRTTNLHLDRELGRSQLHGPLRARPRSRPRART